MNVRFSIQYLDTKFRVMDGEKMLKGRFHTEAQAQEWIDGELLRLAKIGVPQTSMRGRATAHLLKSRDYAGDQERKRKHHDFVVTTARRIVQRLGFSNTTEAAR
jgi:hypothetical protein